MVDSWGPLGKPPQYVLDDPKKLARYRDYVKDAAKLFKLANTKQRAVKMAELRNRFKIEFPEK